MSKAAAWVLVGVCASISAASCSSFGGNESPAGDADGGAAGDDGGSGGGIPGVMADNAIEITAPTTRTFIVQGLSQTISLNVKRGATVLTSDLKITFKDLPDGVTAPDVALSPGATKIDIKLTATAEAAQKLAQVTVIGTASNNDAATGSAKFDLYLRGPSGSKDTTFGTDGHLVVTEISDDVGTQIFLGPHDEIYAYSDGNAACPSGKSCIRRFTADGVPDLGFGTMGLVATRITSDAVVQPDNRWVGCGTGTVRPTLIYRLNPDGSPDMSFGDGSDGPGTMSVLGAKSGETAYSGTALDRGSDGSFAVSYNRLTGSGGSAVQHIGIARLDSKGALIASFAGGGIAGFGEWTPSTIAIQTPVIQVKTTGAVVLAAVNGTTDLTAYDATELGSDGQTYEPFGVNGKLRTLFPNANDIQEYHGKAIFADGSLAFPVVNRIVKISAAGQWDTTFGTNGYVALPIHAYAMAATPDGKVAVFGGSTVMRLDFKGAVDTTFGTAGTAQVDTSITQRGRMAVQSDKRILVLGTNTILRIWD